MTAASAKTPKMTGQRIDCLGEANRLRAESLPAVGCGPVCSSVRDPQGSSSSRFPLSKPEKRNGSGSIRAPAGHIPDNAASQADPARGVERTDAYVSRFTVIGIAPLLNSIHAISIGSTMPAGTSMRIGEPMLIWSARAPMIRAFSNRVYRIGCPTHRAAGEGRFTWDRQGRTDGARIGFPYFNLAQLWAPVAVWPIGWHRRDSREPGWSPVEDFGSCVRHLL